MSFSISTWGTEAIRELGNLCHELSQIPNAEVWISSLPVLTPSQLTKSRFWHIHHHILVPTLLGCCSKFHIILSHAQGPTLSHFGKGDEALEDAACAKVYSFSMEDNSYDSESQNCSAFIGLMETTAMTSQPTYTPCNMNRWQKQSPTPHVPQMGPSPPPDLEMVVLSI